MRLKLFAVRWNKLSKRMKRINTFCGENEFYRKTENAFFSHHVLCVLNTSTLPWTRQKAFPSTTCQSAVSPEPPNHSELRSPVPPPESSYNEPGWGAAGLSQDHRLLSAMRSPLIRRHAPRDYKWKIILQISQFDKHPRPKLSRKTLSTHYIARVRSCRSTICCYRR